MEKLSNFVNKMLEMYQYFVNCNMFQNVFNQIISVLVNKLTPKIIIEQLLTNKENPEKNLINILIESLYKNNQFKYISENEMNSMNFSNDIDALKLISESENEYIKEIIKDNNLILFNDLLIQQMSENLKKKLLYNLPQNLVKSVDILKSFLYNFCTKILVKLHSFQGKF